MQQSKPQLLRGHQGVQDAAVFAAKPKRRSHLFTPRLFVFYWAFSFLCIFSALYTLGFAPDGVLQIGDMLTAAVGRDKTTASEQTGIVSGSHGTTLALQTTYATASSSEPRIIISAIGLNTAIELPKSADLDILNTALLSGPVYYPGSGEPGHVGNVFIFGHSSLLSVVHNQNFKIFNGLKDLKSGDVIRLQWRDTEYWYQVETVAIEKADDAHIDLATDKRLLTLSTCQIIGGKENRYVVQAEFMRSYPLRMMSSSPDRSS